MNEYNEYKTLRNDVMSKIQVAKENYFENVIA